MAASQAKTLLLLLLTVVTLVSSSRVLSTGGNPSVYEVLQQYGLPSGLLPDSVTSYTFNLGDGSFVVELKKPCYIQFEYLTYFSSKITGTLTAGKLSNLGGLQVQSFIFWLNVDEIKVDLQNSNSIFFTMGLIKKELDIKQFETIHSCKANALAYRDHSTNLLPKLPMPVLSRGGQPSVYEVLEQYRLPSGLLPDSVTSYTFNVDDGSFVIELKKPCYIQFEYLTYFATKITGKLTFGKLSNLGGLQVQSFIFWLNVDEIKVDLQNSNSIFFTLGLITKELDIKQFETIRSCKDNALAACDQSPTLVSKLPVPADQVESLIEA